MIKMPRSDYRVPYDGSFRASEAPTKPAKAARNKKRLKNATDRLDDLQKALYAADRHSLLLVFQGMDAAGKDSTIRAVMQGINPAGCQVFSFKKPSARELDHDFLWRIYRSLPERGRIGIFNRSHYEEVLIVRVHEGILDSQKLPDSVDRETIWEDRYESIRDMERHLARNGTMILKFWLNVSKDEQRKRFLDRLNDETKQWKFNPGDIDERVHWNRYMKAFETALNETSREWAPWYAIPADNKPYMRATIAEIICDGLSELGLKYPHPDEEDRAQFDIYRKQLSKPDGQ
jgi:PPK2 family polyphosphate:nucleotide phosphotransferase